MKFQNPSMHSSEVMLCIKKFNGRTNVPEAVCPSNFYEVGGIKKFYNTHARRIMKFSCLITRRPLFYDSVCACVGAQACALVRALE